MTLVESPDQADIIVINTCGFILPAKEEALEVILTLAEEKKESGRELKLIVAGMSCPAIRKELLAEIPEVDLVIGTGERVASFITCSTEYDEDTSVRP